MSSNHQECPNIGLQTINMPAVGFGTLQRNSSPVELEQAMDWALEEGIRMFDTAFMYRNEVNVGNVIKEWLDSVKIQRSKLFIVTKLPMMAMHAEDVEPYCNASLKNLGLDYVDLYLIHSPMGVQKDEETKFFKFYEGNKVKYDHDTDLVSVWRAMEALVDSGKARSIGVSNFNSDQLERVSKLARIPIAVNQVECSLYFQQKKLRETMQKLGIKITAYGTLGSPGRGMLGFAVPDVLDNPVVMELAAAHLKTAGQILLRHQLQSGLIVIPKSYKKERIKQNFNIFDFSLTEEEMKRMDGLDKGSKARSFNFNFFKTDDDITKLKEYPYNQIDSY